MRKLFLPFCPGISTASTTDEEAMTIDDEGVGVTFTFNIVVVEAINDLCWMVSLVTVVCWGLIFGRAVDVEDDFFCWMLVVDVVLGAGVCWMFIDDVTSILDEGAILDEGVILIWTLSTIFDVCTICCEDFSTIFDDDFSTTTFVDEEGVIGWMNVDVGVGGCDGGGMSKKWNENIYMIVISPSGLNFIVNFRKMMFILKT